MHTCEFCSTFVGCKHFADINIKYKMSNKNKNYLMPTTEVVRLKMETQLLAGSQSWPSGAPVNAQRNGYGDANDQVW